MRRRWLKRVRIALLILAVAVAADYILYPRLAPIGGHVPAEATNGAWLRQWWYTGERPPSEAAGLARQLSDRGIVYLYFHVGNVGGDGRLVRGRRESGAALTRALREVPRVRPMAWVGAPNELFGGDVNISDPQVRTAMVEEARWLVSEAGFQGVQWDCEVAVSADDAFMALLHETREALPPGSMISIATPLWVPWPLGRWGWEEEDFRRAASPCDQICVMCYDSGVYLPRAYVWLARQQVVRVAPAVADGNQSCHLLIGVPTYGDEGSLRSHHAYAENLRLALKGLRDGCAVLHSRRPDLPLPAAAVFANWTTEPEEWATWEELW
ncbi:MAG: hypothetical protein U9R79_19720 [Armatimonadota bacterium]|nr:hypothetical protein [Armatimonadota bacterium]